jgi:hypothetical protein
MTTWKLSVSIGLLAGTAVVDLSGIPATAAGPATEPFAFIENRGQWDAATGFLARSGPMVARFEKDAIVLWLPTSHEQHCRLAKSLKTLRLPKRSPVSRRILTS